jgi:hypothetical protein
VLELLLVLVVLVLVVPVLGAEALTTGTAPAFGWAVALIALEVPGTVACEAASAASDERVSAKPAA